MIDFAKLQYQYRLYYNAEIDVAMQAVPEKSNYIMGEEIVYANQKVIEFAG